MPFKVAVVYFSRHGLLVTLANIIAAGARKVCPLQAPCSQKVQARQITHCALQVPGAEVKVYRISDPVRGDNPDHFEEGVLDAPLVTDKVCFASYAHAQLQFPPCHASCTPAIVGYFGC